MSADVFSSKQPRLLRFAAIYSLLTLLGYILMLGGGPLLLALRARPAADSPPTPNPLDARKQAAAALDRVESDRFVNQNVVTIGSISEWDSRIGKGNCILFLDCEWNIEAVAWRRIYSSFATWCRGETTLAPLRFVVNSDQGSPHHRIPRDFLRQHGIHTGGMKNFGGAGRVVWLCDGEVLDYCWYMDVGTVETMIERTRKVFNSTLPGR